MLVSIGTTKKNDKSKRIWDLSVAGKFIALLIFLVLGFFVIGLAYLQVITVNEESRGLANQTEAMAGLIGSIQVDMLEARRAEKNFLIRETESYLETHGRFITQALKHVKEMEVLVDSFDVDDAASSLSGNETLSGNDAQHKVIFQTLSKTIEDYKTFFDELVTGKRKLGLDKESGMKGSLSQSLTAIENRVLTEAGAPATLVLSILTLRQAQNDYLSIANSDALQSIGEEIEFFEENLEDLRLNSALKTSLGDQIGEYQMLWPNVVSLMSGMVAVEKEFSTAAAQIDPTLNELRDFASEQATANQLKIEAQQTSITVFFIATLSIISVVVTGFFVMQIRTFTRWLTVFGAVIQDIAEGNLSNPVETDDRQDEFGQLIRILDQMQINLADVITKTRNSAANVGTAAKEISAGNMNLSQRTQEQASSLEEVAASMEEMQTTVAQNAESAEQANKLAIEARQFGEKGRQVTDSANESMAQIKTASQKIKEIIAVINDISFQTNLLALNAAVEAARAGDQGRGFSVVASEVRNLAGRSATSAKEIKDLIEDSVKKIEIGSNFVSESGEALGDIVASTKNVSEIVAGIASASAEQTRGIAQINDAITGMDEITQENASLVEEAAAASEMMEDQASELNELVAYFKTPAGEKDVKPASRSMQRDNPKPASRSMQREVSPNPRSTTSLSPLSTKKQEENDWVEF